MAWSTPMTAVAGNVFTAAQFNQYVRDLFNETAPAKASAAGQWFISTAANALAARTITSASVATSETTTSTSYTDLATSGPAVATVTGTQALIAPYSAMANSGTGFSVMGVAVSGSSSIAATDAHAVGGPFGTNGGRVSGLFLVTGLTPGSNTFTAKYRVLSGTGTFVDRSLTVLPL
jgi:hypothetical protein